MEASDLLDEGETVEEVKEEEIDAVEAAKKAAQTRTTKQQQAVPTTPGKPVGPGATFSGGPMSTEGKFKMDALDIQYDPKAIAGMDENVLFGEYPKILVSIAKAEPSTIPTVLDRLNTIVDWRNGDYVTSEKWKTLTGYLLDITTMVKGNKQLMLDIAKIVAKVDSKEAWKGGSFSNDVKSNINSIRGMVMGISS